MNSACVIASTVGNEDIMGSQRLIEHLERSSRSV